VGRADGRVRGALPHDPLRRQGLRQVKQQPGQVQPRADPAGLLRALRIEQAAVVGVSLGSITAIDFALQQRAMVRGLVLVGGGVGGGKVSAEMKVKGREIEAPRKQATSISQTSSSCRSSSTAGTSQSAGPTPRYGHGSRK
jgi:pimeloyl-ACP methyl ester carboxylesterase